MKKRPKIDDFPDFRDFRDFSLFAKKSILPCATTVLATRILGVFLVPLVPPLVTPRVTFWGVQKTPFFSDFVPFRAFFSTFFIKFIKTFFSIFENFRKKSAKTAQIRASKNFRKSQKTSFFGGRDFTFLSKMQKPILVSKFFL